MGKFKFLCPYCFHKMTDSDVHFRSEIVSTDANNPLPPEYDSIDDYKMRCQDADKDKVINEYKKFAFFKSKDDTKYMSFWKIHGGATTEESDSINGGHRSIDYRYVQVINPNDSEHQKYLEKNPNGDNYLFYDIHGMVSHVKIKDGSGGTDCYKRVCPSCHNPLPESYGKYPINYTTIIGIRGSGKTVYLAQLINNLQLYTYKVGLAQSIIGDSSKYFAKKNKIIANKKLPDSTPKESFQQPLFYNLTKSTGEGTNRIETFVLYDVPGEIFEEDGGVINNYAKFIEHSNAFIFLVDPYQFAMVVGGDGHAILKDAPATALDKIHSIINKGDMGQKCNVPIAVCISKIDDHNIKELFDIQLNNLLSEDLEVIKGAKGLPAPIFNAKQYNLYGKKLEQFVIDYGGILATSLDAGYNNYNYFAFTALGCEVEENVPKGPIVTKHIEDPLLWIFYKLKYIKADDIVYHDVYCPYCKLPDVSLLEDDDEKAEIIGTKGFIFKKDMIDYYKYRCNNPKCPNKDKHFKFGKESDNYS